MNFLNTGDEQGVRNIWKRVLLRIQPRACCRILLLFSCTIMGCSPWHVAKSSYYQVRLLSSRQSISSVLEDGDALDERTRSRLTQSQRLHAFAPEVGLPAGKQFTSFATAQVPTIWVLSASPKFELTPYTWWFPIVGSIPYKGFFSLEDAREQAEELQQNGYDVSIRSTAAYSTLGWFNDPITETMISLPEEQFIDTFFHELFHTHIWIPGHTAFNETLANLFGHVATVSYTRRYAQEHYAKAHATLMFDCELSLIVDDAHRSLERLYARKDISDQDRSARKEMLLHDLNESVIQITTTYFPDAPRRSPEFNNASLLGMSLYLKDFATLSSIMVQAGGPRSFFKKIEEVVVNIEDPWKDLPTLLQLPAPNEKTTACTELQDISF